MSALFMDSFDNYGTNAAGVANMLDGVWAAVGLNFSVGSPVWGTSRTGTSNLIMSPVSTGQVSRLVIPGSPAVMFFSLGFACDFLPPSTQVAVFDIRSVGNVVQHTLAINPTGSLTLYSGDIGSGTIIATTSGPVIRAQTWHFFEVEVNYSTGNFILRVDDPSATGTPVITATIATSKVNGFLGFTWNNAAGVGFGQYHFDDLFVRDNQGSVNNSWLGDRRIALLMTNADTATAGWTPRFYQKFGSGVGRFGNMTTNSNTPLNPNACITAVGNSSLDVSNVDFTMESFVRFEALPGSANYSTLFGRWDAINNKESYRLVLGGASFNNSCLQFDYTTDGTAGTIHTPIIFPFAPNLNQWYHIALVRASNELLLFVDGAQLGLPIPITDTIYSGGTEPFSLGAEAGASAITANTYLIGMMDETRFTNGFARYTSPFSPPASAFPRGSGDAEWSDVVLLCGYNAGIVDESSFARTLFPNNGAIAFTVGDGSTVGTFSTINKAIPDDNTFISAALTSATGVLTMTTQPSNTQTVTVGTTDGSTAAVYTFKTSLSTAYDVLIDTTAENTLLNLFNAINAGPGIGTKYGTSTLANFDVSATQLPAGQIMVTALTAGTAGNSIASTSTATAATWGSSTLTGGASIPSASRFKVQRPPPNTTLISAVQSTVRAYKSDAGSCVVQSALIGPLGGVAAGATHNLATNPGYYLDIIEVDPDTSLAITPSTLINGSIQINRTA